MLNERRDRNPLVPLSIFRIKGLAAADATQVIAMAGFYSAFFFLTLYMQNVLGFSAVRAGAAYVPAAAMVAVSAARPRHHRGRDPAAPRFVLDSSGVHVGRQTLRPLATNTR